MRSISCIVMRGGTSRGPFMRLSDLPADAEARNAVLLDVMGSGHELEVDGIGGGNPLTSKVALVDRSSAEGSDVDYLFAQVGVVTRFVDTGPNCGNMLSAVGPYAIESGLIAATHPETRVRIRNLNTGALVEAVVQTPDGVVNYAGTTAIDGVPGFAAPIKLTFANVVGSKTGRLLPTGLVSEVIDGTEVTLIDMSVPCVVASAASFSKRGDETAAELDADRDFMHRLEQLRREAGRRMGFGDVSSSVLPKFVLVAEPRRGGTLTARYFVPTSCHKSFATTGGICVATAALLDGSVAARAARWSGAGNVRTCTIEHPSGRMDVELELDALAGVSRASLIRTARKLLVGQVFVP